MVQINQGLAVALLTCLAVGACSDPRGVTVVLVLDQRATVRVNATGCLQRLYAAPKP